MIAALSSDLHIRIATLEFTLRLEETTAPKTCDAFQKLLPFKTKIFNCRWSGEACWVPLGKWEAPLDIENQTSHPALEQILLYAAGPSNTELLVPYGACAFNRKMALLSLSVSRDLVLLRKSPPLTKHFNGRTTRILGRLLQIHDYVPFVKENGKL